MFAAKPLKAEHFPAQPDAVPRLKAEGRAGLCCLSFPLRADACSGWQGLREEAAGQIINIH